MATSPLALSLLSVIALTGSALGAAPTTLAGPEAAAFARLPHAVQEFVRNLPGPRPGERRIALFDHDKTLVRGDIGEQFMKWMIRKGHFPNSSRMRAATVAHKRGKLDELALFKMAVTEMAGLKESRVKTLAQRYYARGFGGFERRIYEPQRALIHALTARGVEVHVVSASNPWIVRESARRFGIPPERVHAMEVAVAGGRLTDRLREPIPWREGKVAAVDAAKLREGGVIVFAAGDSSGDLKMLELAEGRGLSMTVNDHETPAVRRVAQDKGYARARFDANDTAGR